MARRCSALMRRYCARSAPWRPPDRRSPTASAMGRRIPDRRATLQWSALAGRLRPPEGATRRTSALPADLPRALLAAARRAAVGVRGAGGAGWEARGERGRGAARRRRGRGGGRHGGGSGRRRRGGGGVGGGGGGGWAGGGAGGGRGGGGGWGRRGGGR